MNELQTIAHQDVLPAEVLGDTLIVTPHGDVLSHDHREFQADLRALQRIVNSPHVRHMIVDLSGSDYFGSQMLAGLVTLKSALGEEGRAVLCELSESQTFGLKTMRLENEFEVLPSRKSAVNSVVRLSLSDHARRLKTPASVVLLVCLAWGLYESQLVYRVFGSHVADEYESVAQMWTKYSQGAPRGLTAEEQIRWEVELKREIEAARDHWANRDWYLTRDAAYLGRATDALCDLVHRNGRAVPFNQFRFSMAMVRYRLQKRTGIETTGLNLTGDSPEVEKWLSYKTVTEAVSKPPHTSPPDSI